MRKYKFWVMALLCPAIFGCQKFNDTLNSVETGTFKTEKQALGSTESLTGGLDENFAVGVDLSSVAKDVAKGAVYYDKAGNPTECNALFKSFGDNAVRIRVCVNHPLG